MAKIKEKKPTKRIKEAIDKRKDKISTKILIGLTISTIITITGFSIKAILDCGLTTCVLGGAGAGSIIMTIIWLFVDSIKA